MSPCLYSSSGLYLFFATSLDYVMLCQVKIRKTVRGCHKNVKGGGTTRNSLRFDILSVINRCSCIILSPVFILRLQYSWFYCEKSRVYQVLWDTVIEIKHPFFNIPRPPPHIKKAELWYIIYFYKIRTPALNTETIDRLFFFGRVDFLR